MEDVSERDAFKMGDIGIWMTQNGFGGIWNAIQPVLPLIVLIVLAILFFKYVVPKLIDAAADIVMAIVGIVILLLMSSFCGVSIPFITDIQVAVTDWFVNAFWPWLSGLFASFGGR